MRGPAGLRERVDLVRPVVLLALLVGFLAMHGFLALSTGPGHGEHARSVGTDVLVADALTVAHVPDVGHAGAPGDHAVAGAAPAPAPAPAPGPDHHDLLTGCVLALVGVVGLALAAAALLRARTPGWLLRDAVVPLQRTVASAGPAHPPPRLALCVLRV